jgi:hypothetical protein
MYSYVGAPVYTCFFNHKRTGFLLTMGLDDDGPRGLALVRPSPGENSSDSAPQLPQHNTTRDDIVCRGDIIWQYSLSAHPILPISIDIGRPTDGVCW